MRKKILVIGPVCGDPAEINAVVKPLSFLNEHWTLDYLDSLTIMNPLSNAEYYQRWQEKLAPLLTEYEAFFGFSFGGVILQQCFELFTRTTKPIILFSTPTFADPPLTQKLGTVISLCKRGQLEKALLALYEPVFSPKPTPMLTLPKNTEQACARLVFGLNRVLVTDSTVMLQRGLVPHLHLIGECSNLVNKHNVLAPKNGRLLVVPQASMRVLQDNLSFCQKIILEALNGEAS